MPRSEPALTFTIPLILLVGATGFEPATPCAQGRCATRLRYAPTLTGPLILGHFPTARPSHRGTFNPACRKTVPKLRFANSPVPEPIPSPHWPCGLVSEAPRAS